MTLDFSKYRFSLSEDEISSEWITPTKEAIDLSRKIVGMLYEKYGLKPKKVFPTIQGGIYILYPEENNKNFDIEVFNSLGIVSCVIDYNLYSTKNEDAIYCGDIKNLDFSKLVTVFKTESK